MPDDQVTYEVQDRIARLTFNRPEKLNAITFAMRDRFVALLRGAATDPDVRVLIVQGAGASFTSGVDVTDHADVQDPASTTLDSDIAEISASAAAWEQLWSMPKPVIVKARGHCAGWGLEIALFADFVFASLDCQFFFPSVRNGTGLPDSAMAIYHLGPQWTKRMLLTGDALDGATAARIGLAIEAVPDEQLDDAVMSFASRLVAVPAELAAQSKAVVNHAIDLMGRAGLQDFAARANATARRSPEAHEWGRILRDEGLAAAIEWRESRRG